MLHPIKIINNKKLNSNVIEIVDYEDANQVSWTDGEVAWEIPLKEMELMNILSLDNNYITNAITLSSSNLSYDNNNNNNNNNKIHDINNNYNTEFEFLFTLASAISYRIYKKIEIEDLKNTPDIAMYMKIRQQTFIIILCILLIFTKNVNNKLIYLL